MNSDAFCDQVVIITGASAGIGKSLALLLASQGAKVAIAARRVERLEEVEEECQSCGGEGLVVPTEVGDEEQCKNLVKKTIATFGRLDVLINNAGLAVTVLLREYVDLRLFRHVMDVNFYGAVYCTYYALHGFYDSLRMEMQLHRVSVSVICPYWVVTEFHEELLDKNGAPRGKQGRVLYTKKMMTAERCAASVLNAAYKRKRELLMSPGGLLAWLKLIAPGFLDRLTIKMILEPIAKRIKAGNIGA